MMHLSEEEQLQRALAESLKESTYSDLMQDDERKRSDVELFIFGYSRFIIVQGTCYGW